VNDDEVLDAVRSAIATVAPEVDLDEIRPDDDLWLELELDSMDRLSVMTAVGERLRIEIPDRDLTGLRSRQDIVRYCTERARA
jgi:acyl carrier protein